MSDITRHGIRFTFLVGFDLGKPRMQVRKYIPGHYGMTLGWIEFHFMFGCGRDLTLDILNYGIIYMEENNIVIGKYGMPVPK